MTGFALHLPDDVIDEIARRAAALVVGASSETGSPYMTVAEAAAYARCKRQRIYDLVSARRLTRYRDGSRVLVRRDELDGYLAEASTRAA